jgi:outer membrane receptor for ferrienterochelin and colicins
LNLKWILDKNITLRGSYSRGFRAPSLKELYLDFVDVNHNITGNEDLTSENSHNMDVSMSYQRETHKNLIGSSIDLFYNKLNDLIKLVPVVGQSNPNAAPFYTYVNIGNYVSTGFQADVSYNIYPRFTIKAGVTETGRKYGVDEDFQVDSEFLYSTDVNFNFTYSLIKWSIDFSAFYKYTGKYPEFSYDEVNEIYYKGYVDDYHMMDVSIMKTFYKRTLQLTTGIKNIFDVNTIMNTATSGEAHSGNTGSGQLTGWGRTFFLSVSYNFNQF